MIIQHNIAAMNAGEANRKNVSGLKKKTEKLSTGYKINRSADNASGLSVSEKMRSQIRGLSQASNNANDSISLIQTAEGGLNETEDILQRMRELAVQSANGTYTDDDREQIQYEVNALKSEIDRVAESTEFNEMKLLNGDVHVTLNSLGKTNEYGALYGSTNKDLAIGGGKVCVTSSIEGVWLKFTTGASGKGGENAVYSYDTARTNGDLSQHITINLAKGEKYTDDQINKLIENAVVQKSTTDLSTWEDWPVDKAAVHFKSQVGFIIGAEAETYGLKLGQECQEFTGSLDLREVCYVDPDLEIETIYNSNNGSLDIIRDTENTTRGIYVDIDNEEITLNGEYDYSDDEIKQALIDAGLFDNNNKDENGNYMSSDRLAENISVSQTTYHGEKIVKYSSKIPQRQATYKVQNFNAFTIKANTYGSYLDYQENLDKYQQPDAKDAFNLKAIQSITYKVDETASQNINISNEGGLSANGLPNNNIVVTLKKGAVLGPDEIPKALRNYLSANGFDYTVDIDSISYNFKVTGGASDPLDTQYLKNHFNLNDTIKIKRKSDRHFIVGDTSVTSYPSVQGQRSIKRTGTIPGVRQTAEGDLTPLMIRPGSGTLDSSDQIKFTANSYGKATDYDNIVQNFVISTEQNMPAGEETVEVNGERATIHLATGTRYTNDDIQKLLKKAGLDYTVELTDSHDPDGDYDGSVYFNTAGSVNIMQTAAGQGVGLTDVADIKDQLEFQIGANGVEDQKVGMDLIDASASALGVASIDVSTQDGANKAIEQIDEAVKKVSTFRASMGALQNRMEYSVNSLNTANENLTASESQIRDTDVASEMVEYNKLNILNQASQAMLSQANNQTEGVLNLLRS